MFLNLTPANITYRWDLNNDGHYNDAEGAETSVVFYQEGRYTINLQATDLLGRVSTASTTVVVYNAPPFVDIGQDREADEGGEITFSAIATDPGNDPLHYEWDFGDGSPRVTGTLSPTHIYLDDGHYTVRLRVSDDAGAVTEDSLIVRVRNLPPLVDAGPDQQVDEGAVVTLSGQATDPGVLDTLTYEWDLNYDGRTFISDAAGPTVSTVYPTGPATVIAALRVRDKDGAEALGTVEITVNNAAPTITRITHNGPVGEGSPVSIAVEAIDPGNDRLSFAFDWQNSGHFEVAGEAATASYTWYNQGDYVVGIRVDDGFGGHVFSTTTVSVYNEAPVAVASADSVALEGVPVRFNAGGSYDPGLYDILTYTWHFGDGQTAEGLSVSNIYADNGIYTATLTVTDDSGASSSDTVQVTILNANPIVNAGPDITVDEGADVPVIFTGAASDPGSADNLSYTWDFDYDGVTFNPDASGASVTWHYSNLDGPSERVVALRVRDDDYPYPTDRGGQIGEAIDTLKVIVRNTPPVVDAGGSYLGLAGHPVILTGTATDAPSDLPTLTYTWDLDGEPAVFDTSGQTITATWQTAGVYTVGLYVTDKDGDVGFDTAQVIINALPTAEAGGPYRGDEGVAITLDGSGSIHPTGQTLSYTWDFGDGSPPVDGMTVTHVYINAGVYTATLQVDDGSGGRATDTATVVVNDVPPTAVINVGVTTVQEGDSITFDAAGSTAGNYDTLAYQWDFGDGSAIAAGPVVVHTYADSGQYPVTLTVIDDDGSAATATVEIIVVDAEPVDADVTSFSGLAGPGD